MWQINSKSFYLRILNQIMFSVYTCKINKLLICYQNNPLNLSALSPQAIYGAVNLLVFYSSSTFWTWVGVFIHKSTNLTWVLITPPPSPVLNLVFLPVATAGVCTSSVYRELPLHVCHGQASVCWGWKSPGRRNRLKHGAGNGRVSKIQNTEQDSKVLGS